MPEHKHMKLFEELKRRNVFRVGIAYTVTAWLLIQVTDIVFPRIGLPDSAVTLVIGLLAIGFLPALIFATSASKGQRHRDLLGSQFLVRGCRQHSLGSAVGPS